MIELPTRKILLVDDDDAVRTMMTDSLESQGFKVVPASNVMTALKFITSETFDVLLTDLHMPNAADGFTLITAMRHTQPDALTLLVSGYPDVQTAMATILLEADKIIVKPFDSSNFADLIRQKMSTRKPAKSARKQRVAEVLQRSVNGIIADWLERSGQSKDLNKLTLRDSDRTGHLAKLVQDIALRLSKGNTTITGADTSGSVSAFEHGKLRYLQGYTPSMLVQESRILQVTIFETLQSNREHLDFSLLLPDVMTIADEVDSQLTQSMSSYMLMTQFPAAQ